MILFQINELPDQINIITLTGRLDAEGTAQVELPLTAIISGSGCHTLIDLEALDFIGSLGIRLLLSAARVLERHGRRMVLFGVQPPVQEVFETVALGTLILIAEDEAAALAALAA